MYAQAENGRRVQTDERAAGPLVSRGVRATPGESATPAAPGMTYDLPYCRGTYTQAARVRANRARLYVYASTKTRPLTPRGFARDEAGSARAREGGACGEGTGMG